MSKKYKQQVIFLPFSKVEKMFNDLEDKINRFGKEGYRLVATEKGMVKDEEHILIIMEKEEE